MSNKVRIEQRKLKGDEIALKVRIADLRRNSELSRLDTVKSADLKHLRKHMGALVILGDMTHQLETPAGPFLTLTRTTVSTSGLTR